MQWGQGRYDEVVAIFLLLFADHRADRPASPTTTATSW